MKSRSVVPEILDTLPHHSPVAKRSRRDLSRINFLMGGYRWIGREIAKDENETAWFEVGSGDGRLACHLSAEGAKLSGLDFAPRPEQWPRTWQWITGDIFEGLASLDSGDHQRGLIGNLFLHHLDQEQLKRLGTVIEHSFHRVICSEPARYGIFEKVAHLLFPILNEVTRHDMLVSIRAGFRPGELREALGLSEQWQVRETVTWLGAYRFDAWRK